MSMTQPLKNPQMATPISSLPLKTTQEVSTLELEDPEIQSLMKDFERDSINTQQQYQSPPQQQYIPQPLHQQPHHQQPQYQQPQYQIPQQSQIIQPNKLLNIEYVKRALIISIIASIFFNTNMMQSLISKMPETIINFTSGREIIINTIVLFVIFYILIFYNLI